jgi:thiamine transport system ATP-binding protein
VTHDQEEAFAVADRMALMRHGRVVQSGTVDDVWRAPVDAEAARFLGYATVLEGAAAHRVLVAGGSTAAGPVALRRSALRHDPDGPLSGRVLAARMTPELVRLTVDVPDVGAVDAVADPGVVDAADLAVGHEVHLVVDLTRAAPLSRSDSAGPNP